MKRVALYFVFVVTCLVGGTFVAVGCSSLASLWGEPVTTTDPPADLPPAAEGHVWANVSGVWVEVKEADLATSAQIVTLPNGVRFVIPAGDGEGQTTGGLFSSILGGLLAVATGNPMLAPIIGGAIKRAGDGLAGVTLARRREEDQPTTPAAAPPT